METEFLLVFSKLQYECGKADLDCNTAFWLPHSGPLIILFTGLFPYSLVISFAKHKNTFSTMYKNQTNYLLLRLKRCVLFLSISLSI